ncbi:MAG: hypothetical protein ACE5NA_00005, partial [Nitrospiraceae bacterium]
EVVAWDHSEVVAWDHSKVVARGRSEVVAWDHSEVVAWDHSKVDARGRSEVVARGHSKVVAWNHSKVDARGHSKVDAGPCVSVRIIGHRGNVRGGVAIGAVFTAEEWVERCGLVVEDDSVILYKAAGSHYKSDYNPDYRYEIGSEVVAQDWADDGQECGGGLHFGWSPRVASSFHSGYKHIVACSVKVSDIATVHDEHRYPDKCRARACTVLYEVDLDGNRLEEQEDTS